MADNINVVIENARFCSGCLNQIGTPPEFACVQDPNATIDTVIQKWGTTNCISDYSIYINIEDITVPQLSGIKYTQLLQEIVQTYVLNLFRLYLEKYTFTDNKSDPKYNDFQYEIQKLCTSSDLPGVCESALNSYCTTMTRNQIQSSVINTSLCGCYATPDPDILSITNDPSCDPLCTRITSSKKAIPQSGELLECRRGICVIDQVAVDITNSSISGGVNFNTICSGCSNITSIGPTGPTGPSGNTGCICIVKGVSINGLINQTGVGSNFNLMCGDQSVCFIQDNQGNTIKSGNCQELNINNVNVPKEYSGPNIGLVALMVLLILIVIIIIIFLRARRKE